MNDTSKSRNLLDFITYADDATLTSIPSTSENTRAIDNSININTEIKKISDWLQINLLSVNMNKTNLIIFHKHNKVLRIPNIIFDNTPIQHVNRFNFLGLHLDSNMLWNTHINSVVSKVTRSI